MVESALLYRFLLQRLKADTALAAIASPISGPLGGRIFLREAKQNTPFPFVVIQIQASPDRRGGGGAKIFTRPVFLVKAVGESADFPTLQAIADRIDALLDGVREARLLPPEVGAPGYVAGQSQAALEVRGIHRIAPFEMPEPPSVLHYGATYRAIVHPQR